MKLNSAWTWGVLALHLAGLANAHDLYLMPDRFVASAGANIKVFLHSGDEFPEGTSPVRPIRLRNTRLLSNAGTAAFENLTKQAKWTTANVRIPGTGIAILTANTIPNFIKLDAAKFHSYLEHENLTNAIQWRAEHNESKKAGRERYSKYVKSLIQSGPGDGFYNHVAGLTIEIVPEADPYSLQPGQALPVQVLFRGKPAADTAVESAWLENGKAQVVTIGRTDAAGRIRIPIKAKGPHRIHAIVMERCAEPKAADWESFWASLTFAIQ